MKTLREHRLKHYLGVAAALALSVLLAAGFVGCKNDPASQVAATVNGTEILESDITARIESFRIDTSTGEPQDDVAWAQMLKAYGYTPETLREYIIRNEFGSWILVLQRAAEKGITPDSTQVDEDITSARESVTGSGETWEDYLKSMGFASEAAYRQMVEAQNVVSELLTQSIDSTPTQEEIETYVSENAAQYACKRVSLIYLPYDVPVTSTEEGATEEDTGEAAEETNTADVVRPKADEALAKLREGADFAEVAKEYSQAGGVEEDGGDLGWRNSLSLPESTLTALDSLPVNEVSDVLDTNFGTEDSPSYAFLIVKWTEEFVVPEQPTATEGEGEGAAEGEEGTEGEATGEEAEGEEASTTPDASTTSGTQTVEFSAVPASLVEMLTEDYTSEKLSTTQQEYFTALVESDEIVINPMPEGLSYNVDMTLADTAEEEQTDEGTTETETETSEGQLEISDTVVGTGLEAATGDTVEIHYTGYLEDGTVFDSSVERGTPFEVTLGQGQVIQGWEQGIPGMKVGGKRTLVIPPALAYGETGKGSIPGNATLTFEVELVSVNGDSTGYSENGGEGGESDENVAPADGEGSQGEG